jgi:hypothetical protein
MGNKKETGGKQVADKWQPSEKQVVQQYLP